MVMVASSLLLLLLKMAPTWLPTSAHSPVTGRPGRGRRPFHLRLAFKPGVVVMANTVGLCVGRMADACSSCLCVCASLRKRSSSSRLWTWT